MACAAFTADFPQAPNGMDYEQYIRQQASLNGLMCGLANYQANCQTQCTNVALAQVSSSNNTCFQCLSTLNTCQNPGAVTQACCPFMTAATQCNDCLNRYEVDALQTCLQTGGLSTGAIVGIVLGCVAFVIICIGVG